MGAYGPGGDIAWAHSGAVEPADVAQPSLWRSHLSYASAFLSAPVAIDFSFSTAAWYLYSRGSLCPDAFNSASRSRARLSSLRIFRSRRWSRLLASIAVRHVAPLSTSSKGSPAGQNSSRSVANTPYSKTETRCGMRALNSSLRWRRSSLRWWSHTEPIVDATPPVSAPPSAATKVTQASDTDQSTSPSISTRPFPTRAWPGMVKMPATRVPLVVSGGNQTTLSRKGRSPPDVARSDDANVLGFIPLL